MILTADGIYDLILPAQVDTGSSTRGFLFSGDLGGATATIGYLNDFGDFVPFKSDSAELGKNFKSGQRLDLEHGAGVLPKLKIVGSTSRTEIYVKVAAVRQGGVGTAGAAGVDGADGKSAYQTWLDNGNTGTEADFLASIDGADGVALRTGTVVDVGNSSDTQTNLYGDVTATGDVSSNNGEHILSNKANGGFLANYVRAWSNGNTSNTSNHYTEIQAIGLDGSVVSGIGYKMGVDGVKQTSDARLTDGDTTIASTVTVDSGRAGVLLELDTATVISEVKLWRYYINGRTYFETAIEISEDGVNWYAIHDYSVVGIYAESSSGYTAKASIDKIMQLGLSNKVNKVASTDNAIARFDGTTGDIQDSGVIVDDNSNVLANNYSLNPGYGVRLWNSDAYKMHMGNSTEYHFGKVTSYAIKFNMSSNSGRGWVWGLNGSTPVAALTNTGDLDLAGGIVAQGYTKLGDTAPAIKQKKLTGITASSQGASVFIAHNLTGDKILDITVKVQSGTNIGVFAENNWLAGSNFSATHGSTNLTVHNSSSNSSNILSKPFTALITYEE